MIQVFLQVIEVDGGAGSKSKAKSIELSFDLNEGLLSNYAFIMP
jgi:hypothetical protein